MQRKYLRCDLRPVVDRKAECHLEEEPGIICQSLVSNSETCLSHSTYIYKSTAQRLSGEPGSVLL